MALDGAAWVRIAESAAAVGAILARGTPAHGINTGFGKLAHVHIGADGLAALQRNIVLSHAAGVGAPMPVARLMQAFKLASLAQGASGLQPGTVALLEAVRAALRREVPGLADDRYFAPDVAAATKLASPGAIAAAAAGDMLPGLDPL